MVKILVYFFVLSLMNTCKCNYLGLCFHCDKQHFNWEEEEEGHRSLKLTMSKFGSVKNEIHIILVNYAFCVYN